MNLHQHVKALGIFKQYQDVEQALRVLHRDGFPMNQVSVVMKEPVQGQPQTLGFHHLPFSNLNFVHVPNLGSIIASGPILSLFADGRAFTPSLCSVLTQAGIPEAPSSYHEQQVRQGHPLIFLEGTEAQLHQAEMLLQPLHLHDWSVYSRQEVAATFAEPSYARAGYHPHGSAYSISDRVDGAGRNSLRSRDRSPIGNGVSRRQAARRPRSNALTLSEFNGRPATVREVGHRHGYQRGDRPYLRGRLDEHQRMQRNLHHRDNHNAARGLLVGIAIASLVAIVMGVLYVHDETNDANPQLSSASTPSRVVE